MPARWFFSVLENIEAIEFENRNIWLHELLDVMPAAQCVPEYRQGMQKIYRKRIMGETYKELPSGRPVMQNDNPQAIAFMENVFKKAGELVGKRN